MNLNFLQRIFVYLRLEFPIPHEIFFLKEWGKWGITISIPRGMGKWGISFFHSPGNEEKTFPPRGSPKFPKISKCLNLRQIERFFEPIFYSIQMCKTIHFSNIVVKFIISFLIKISQNYNNLLCWSWKHNLWDAIACTFDNKFKNALPISSQPSFAEYSACATLTLVTRLGGCRNSSTFLSLLSK